MLQDAADNNRFNLQARDETSVLYKYKESVALIISFLSIKPLFKGRFIPCRAVINATCLFSAS